MDSTAYLRDLLRRLNQEGADLTAPPNLTAAGPEWSDADHELAAFLARIVELLRTLDGAVSKMGVKEALSVLQVRRLTELLDSQHKDIAQLTTGIGELAQGVTKVAEDTHQAAQAAGQMQEAGVTGLADLQQVLAAISDLEGQAKAAQSSFGALVETTRQTTAGLQAIRGLADTSRLLALNAAIQAAHANDRAFGVVAGEVRRLSDRTGELVRQIEGRVTGLDASISAAAAAMEQMAGGATQAGRQAQLASSRMAEVHRYLNHVSESIQSIAAVAEQQAAATEEMNATAESLSATLQAASASMDLTRNLAISDVAEQAHAALGRVTIGSRTDRMRRQVGAAAGEVEATVERLVAQGTVSLDSLWDFGYQELKGSAIATLGRIFRVDRVPAGGFAPPKYRTAYDQQIDLPLIDLLDRIVARDRVELATVVDLNAFAIAHPRMMAADWTGAYDRDLRSNRIKRLFTSDPSVLAGARVGLPPALARRDRITAADRGTLPPPSPVRPFLLQTYALDSGVVVLAMNVPLYIKGRRWAALRIGYRPED